MVHDLVEESTVEYGPPVVPDLPLLLVDDEPAVLRALQKALSRGGWSILRATSADEALDTLVEHEVAVVISDFRLPGMDGVGLLSDVRRRYPTTERILLSAHASVEALERGINDAGIHRIIHKPWRRDDLMSTVTEAVDANRLRRERNVLTNRLRNRNDELSYLNRLLCDRVAKDDLTIVTFRRRWDAALDAISDPIVVIGPGFVIEGFNKAVEGLAQSPREQIEGRTCYQALFAKRRPCEKCPIEHGAGRLQLIRNGVNMTLEADAFVLPGGEPAHICVYRDVTERVALERDAAHMEKLMAIGRLSSAVAHEINNPLQTIFSFVQLAQQRSDGPAMEKIGRYLQVIRESAVRCKEIVGALREYARKDILDKVEVVDICELCDKAIVLFSMVKDPQVRRADARSEPLYCHASASKLHQVIVNLIQNAIDASHESGVVEISVTGADDEIVLTVEDGGAGVAPEIRDNIFEPFFTTKPAGVGTGLGLAISHSIVGSHGGSLRVSDSAFGGACFELRLPRVCGQATGPTSIPGNHAP